jgi:hypothetical protein
MLNGFVFLVNILVGPSLYDGLNTYGKTHMG